MLRLNIANCTFRNLTERAIDLRPGLAPSGAVGVHNCVFEDIKESAVRIHGGESHLVQNCAFRRVGRENGTNGVIEIVGYGINAHNGAGDLVTLHFQAADGQAISLTPTVVRAQLNEATPWYGTAVVKTADLPYQQLLPIVSN